MQLLVFKLVMVMKDTDSETNEQNETERKNERNNKWLEQIKKCFKILYRMEKYKYLEPKFSMHLYPLMRFLKDRYGFSASSTNTSFYS